MDKKNEVLKGVEDDHEFKNFHRTLCERFGYTHDERDWKRDQLSLIEWIAKKVEQPAQQEPVAWMDEKKRIVYWHNTHDVDDYHGFKRTTPLYESPPQRPWVGLTYEEGNDIAFNFDVPSIVVWTVEDNLKEKNT